jgi:hypothetical protein
MIKGLVKLSYSFYYMAQADACANKGARLLQQIGNGQLNNINNLFTSYGY